MARFSEEIYDWMRKSYERAYGVSRFAETLAEREGINVSRVDIIKEWNIRRLEIRSITDLLEEKIKEYAPGLNYDSEKITFAIVGELRKIDPKYGIGFDRIRNIMIDMGIKPPLKKRGAKRGKQNSVRWNRTSGKKINPQNYWWALEMHPDAIK